MEIQLGQFAKDIITGFHGTVVAKASYLTGCDQYALQPDAISNDFKESRWFDVSRIEVTNTTKPTLNKDEKNGCDIAPPKV